SQRLITMIAVAVILGYMALLGLGRSGVLPPRLLVHLSGTLGARADGQSSEAALRDVLREAEQGSARVDLRRVDTEGPAFHATLVLDLERADEVGPLLTRLEKVLPGGSISVVEGNSLD